MTNAQLKHFYAGKKVWLSGHTGFKGAWSVLWLTAMGAKVSGFSLLPENGRPSLFDLANISDKIEHSIIGDIRELDKLKNDMTGFAPDIVIHMAAQALVRRSYVNPIETYTTNVLGTANVLEAVRTCPTVKSVVIVTTDRCYENREWFWPYRENDMLGGYDPYSSSKACAEIVSQAWRRSYLVEQRKGIATARAGNVIGGGDFSEDRIIPDFIRALQKNKNLIIRAPEAIRPWQHVLDVVRGYFILAYHLYHDIDSFSEAFNFSPEGQPPTTVKSLIDKIITKIGRGSYCIDPSHFTSLHESTFLRLDSSKAASRLGWGVVLSQDECIEMTATWYDEWLAGKNANQITYNQIEVYQSLLP